MGNPDLAPPINKTGQRWIALVFIALTIWGVTDVRSRAHWDPAKTGKHRTDLTIFTEAGAAFFDGRDPYQVSNPRGWHYTYPPLFAILLTPLDSLSPQWQGMVWFFLNLGLIWGCYRECRRLLKLFPGHTKKETFPLWIGGGALAAVFIPALDCLQRGQVEIVLVYFLLLGFRLVGENMSKILVMGGGVLLTLPAIIKVLPALPVFILLFMGLVAGIFNADATIGKNRFIECLTGVVAGLLLFIWILPGALVGWEANRKHLQSWYTKVPQKDAVNIAPHSPLRSARIYRNQSMDNAIYRFGNWIAYQFFGGPTDRAPAWKQLPMDAPRIQTAILYARISIIILLLILGYRMARYGDALGLAAAFGMACVAALIVSPMSRGNYFLLQLPALLFVPFWFVKRGQIPKARVLVFIPVILSFLHYIFLPFFGRIGLLGIGTALWFIFISLHMMMGLKPGSTQN